MNLLITGAAGGIGKACVHYLMSSTNIDVIAVSRSEEELVKLKDAVKSKYKKDLDILVIEFEDDDFQDRIAQYISDKYGYLTFLINNAGLLINKDFEKMSSKDLIAQTNINFFAPFKLIQSLLPLMRKSSDPPHVVNISSMGGFQGSSKFPGLSAYSASKSALATLTECLASEYKGEEISFNCLSLGSANTSMLREAFPEYVSPMSPEKMAEFIVDFTLKSHAYINGKVVPVASVEK